MRNKQMPDKGLEGLGVRRDCLRIYDGNEDADVGQLRCGAAIASDDAGNRRAFFARVPQGGDEIRADVFLDVASANGEYEDHIQRAEPARAEPVAIRGVPAFVVYARGEFRNIVCDGIRFDARDFAEIAGGVRGVAGSSSDAEKKEAAAAITQCAQEICGAFNLDRVDFRSDFDRFAEVLMSVGGSPRAEKTGFNRQRSSGYSPAARKRVADGSNGLREALNYHVRNSAAGRKLLAERTAMRREEDGRNARGAAGEHVGDVVADEK